MESIWIDPLPFGVHSLGVHPVLSKKAGWGFSTFSFVHPKKWGKMKQLEKKQQKKLVV